MAPPSAKEINPCDDLDGRIAQKHFLGKTVQQAEVMFREEPWVYGEDLLWMGPVAFRYYIPAVIRFFRDETVRGQDELLVEFAGTLEFRLEREPAELAPIAHELAATCDYIVEHYDRLGSLPPTQAQAEALTEGLRAAFAALKDVLEEASFKPEDFIDLRPRFRALRQALSELARSQGG